MWLSISVSFSMTIQLLGLFNDEVFIVEKQLLFILILR